VTRHHFNIALLWFIVALCGFTSLMAGRQALRGITTGQVAVPARGEHTPVKRSENPRDYWVSVSGWGVIGAIFLAGGAITAVALSRLK
jgi:hypothetical protein